MRTGIISVILTLALSSASLANSSLERVWNYLAKNEYSEQWAVISVAGNKGYFQCERFEDHLRCPFPVWAKLVPDLRLYTPVAVRSTPHPDMDGTETNSYMTDSQVDALTALLEDETLEFARVYSRLNDENGAPAGTSHDVELILELDYPGFERLVERVLRTVWEANTAGGYEVETDQ